MSLEVSKVSCLGQGNSGSSSDWSEPTSAAQHQQQQRQQLLGAPAEEELLKGGEADCDLWDADSSAHGQAKTSETESGGSISSKETQTTVTAEAIYSIIRQYWNQLDRRRVDQTSEPYQFIVNSFSTGGASSEGADPHQFIVNSFSTGGASSEGADIGDDDYAYYDNLACDDVEYEEHEGENDEHEEHAQSSIPTVCGLDGLDDGETDEHEEHAQSSIPTVCGLDALD